MLFQMSVRVTLFGAPPQKDFEARHQKNQKAFAYGTEAGSGSHLANQEAPGAGKAFAYGMGAGGRSHLAKLRDGVRHCNSALSLSFLVLIFSGAAKAPWRPAPERIRSKNETQCTEIYAALRDGARHCNR